MGRRGRRLASERLVRQWRERSTTKKSHRQKRLASNGGQLLRSKHIDDARDFGTMRSTILSFPKMTQNGLQMLREHLF